MSKRKNPFTEDNPNHDFCNFLMELAEYEKNVSRDIHKYNVYRKAAATLADYPSRIKSGTEAKCLKGIGDKIGKKIDEFLATGKLQKLENIHGDSKNEAINLLTRVTGIGPAKAHSLVKEGITSLEELNKNTDKLTHHQIIGLKYFEDFEKKIPRQEVAAIEKLLVKYIKNIDPEYKISICGSYRRGKSESGDIDTLITHPSWTSDKVDKKHKNNMLKNIVNVLEKCGLITDTLSLGETKFMGACRLDLEHPVRRLDIRLTPHDQYYCSILYFTGSDVFNKSMRAHALEQGFTLNEYTLRPVGSTGVPGEPVEISSEEDIFDIIDYPYKKPEDRNS
ncbi:unnamed protein product [Psylliodes chrysocephalus]|uniref:DNA polymerase n=1 Tax=Psylliodes chrysocephalus TaxID=3402493 RepID=A0A9P0D521_9CUCU|nr:unnamed protein product [Psylliodes chrysocephala]